MNKLQTYYLYPHKSLARKASRQTCASWGYIDKLNEFEGATLGVDKVAKDEIKEKVLNVGVPKGATQSQVEQIQKAIEYGKNLNIKVEINVVK